MTPKPLTWAEVDRWGRHKAVCAIGEEADTLLAALRAGEELAQAINVFTQPGVGHFFVGHEREWHELNKAVAAWRRVVERKG